MDLLDPKATRSGELPSVGDLVLCGACGTPNIITIMGTREATQTELDSLTEDERKDFAFAVRQIKQGRKDN